jgi:flagellar protein FlaG
MNMPVHGVGGQSKIEPAAASTTNKDTPQVISDPDKVTTVTKIESADDLKKAELRGDSIPVSQEQLIKAIERAIKAVQGPETSLQFSVHKETKMITAKVINKETGQVIREVPPEKTLDLIANLWKVAGILIDERA